MPLPRLPLLAALSLAACAAPVLAQQPTPPADSPAAVLSAPSAPPSFYTLIVGGGPDVNSNAAQIEGHTKFVAGLTAGAAKRIVLFADGKAGQDTVTYADTSAGADARRAVEVLLVNHFGGEPVLHRAPKLEVPLDGPARLQDWRSALGTLSALAAKQPAPLLLYFAGHGSHDKNNDRYTHYDLWNGDKLTVRDLANELGKLPRDVPVVLVMAQCFSGAFGDVLFSFGDPAAKFSDQDIAGFFSARRDREAAGCSYATERADYQDFSSYFFGALSGKDRFGEAVTGADYDGDGHVSLHEAFCYTLIHDPSADTPVSTSDVFLMHKAVQGPDITYRAPYPEVWQLATPAQRAVLDALSERLGLTGDARALTVFDRMVYGDPMVRPATLQRQSDGRDALNAVRWTFLGPFFERWPALRWKQQDSEEYKKAFDNAVGEMTKDADHRNALLAARKTRERTDEAVEKEEADLLRFATLYEHLVEARELRAHGKPDLQARYEKLWQAEQRELPLAGAAAPVLAGAPSPAP